jgi:hypothetical protein
MPLQRPAHPPLYARGVGGPAAFSVPASPQEPRARHPGRLPEDSVDQSAAPERTDNPGRYAGGRARCNSLMCRPYYGNLLATHGRQRQCDTRLHNDVSNYARVLPPDGRSYSPGGESRSRADLSRPQKTPVPPPPIEQSPPQQLARQPHPWTGQKQRLVLLSLALQGSGPALYAALLLHHAGKREADVSGGKRLRYGFRPPLHHRQSQQASISHRHIGDLDVIRKITRKQTWN